MTLYKSLTELYRDEFNAYQAWLNATDKEEAYAAERALYEARLATTLRKHYG